ncbi:MAG: methylated-DNA--[protein]-cysteine S-methyltransferase [Clostridium sp.]|nr:methylated-DNA--[protein]-cysteine S-methyltransferase [Clostridium sp.]MCM1444307.1 methylated-DNA--[protein]-cysteine S-methyltransferase [Candidatus Amulumruptor caecigallinarius]
MEYKSLYSSPVGKIILTSDGKYLTGLWFTTSRFLELRNVLKEQINDELEIFNITKKWLDRYFNGEKPNLNEVPIKLIGTDFSNKVWNILKKIPYGDIVTYKQIAEQIKKENGLKNMSSQAVGHAVGYNKVSIIVPCHRVVGSNGSLTGYGGGLDVKIGLLRHEKVDVDKFFRPKKGKAL